MNPPRFALSAAGVAAGVVASPALAEDITITMHLDYWAAEHGMSFSNASGGIFSFDDGGYIYAFASGAAVVIDTSLTSWTPGVSPYTSGYRWTIHASVDAGDYDVLLTDSYGDGWAWNNVTGEDAFSISGCVSGDVSISFSSGSSRYGAFSLGYNPCGCPSTDCDRNGVCDKVDISDGAADCDGDGILDECETAVVAVAASADVPPVAEPLTLDTIGLADGLGDPVLIAVSASTELAAAAEYLVLQFDGVIIDFLGADDGLDCSSQVWSVEIPWASWVAAAGDGSRLLSLYASPAVDPSACVDNHFEIEVRYPGVPVDCNANGIWDECELASGEVQDCNGNGIPDSCDIGRGGSGDVDGNGVPDECKPDCNGNGLPDAYEIAAGLEQDCNTNGHPDSCDIEEFGEPDCDADGLIDFCAIADGTVPDCNANEIPDSCDLADGTSNDIDTNGVPDECKPDCNGNGLPDAWEIATGQAADCNGNATPDWCDIASDDESDCDNDGLIDTCAIADGTALDCNLNAAPDDCDIAAGSEGDDNANGIPDSCDLARGDLDLDGCVGPADLGFMLALWGIPNPPTGDLTGDGVIGPADLGYLLANWDCGP